MRMEVVMPITRVEDCRTHNNIKAGKGRAGGGRGGGVSAVVQVDHCVAHNNTPGRAGQSRGCVEGGVSAVVQVDHCVAHNTPGRAGWGRGGGGSVQSCKCIAAWHTTPSRVKEVCVRGLSASRMHSSWGGASVPHVCTHPSLHILPDHCVTKPLQQ